jgi:hypothetical protein
MKPIQQVPGAKVVAIETAGQKRYVLCYSASMGYYIAASIKAEDVVICAANRARRMADAIGATAQIFFINESGNDELVTVHGSQVVDMNMMFPEEKAEEKKVQLAYRFVNRDGNFLRFYSPKGYYIDANGPAYQIVTFFDEIAADDFVADMQRQNRTLKDLNGVFVDSNLTVHISELA